MKRHPNIAEKTPALLVACGLLIWTLQARAETAQSDSPSDRSNVLAEQAVKRNPGIAAIKSSIQALEQRIRKAGAWLDPMLAVEYSNIPIDSWTLGDHGMSGLQFRLQQTFYFPGKVGLREEVAKGEVRQEHLLLEERKVQLRAAVKRAYYSLALVRHLKKVTDDHIKLVDQFIDVVRVKYEVGKVGQHDLLRLTVLKNKLKDDLKSFDRDDRALTATINATLHRAVGVPIKTPERISEAKLRQTIKQLTTEAKRSRPLLRWYLEQAKTRRAAAKQAAREGYPDLTAWIGYRVRTEAGPDSGTDFFSAGISVPIPLSYNSRWGSLKRENKARARAAEQQREAELDRIRAGLGERIAAWKRASQEAKTYRKKLMPQAHRTLDATFAAYQVDRADFASLFQAEIQLLEFERTIRRAEAKAALSRVEVEALTGKQIR
jgi:cobalt-zinc-cadmium efflux system outer membrane protein